MLLLLTASISYAQGVSRMFGLVGGGVQANQSSNGFLFSTDSTGNGFQVKYDFPVTTFGANPANLEMAAYNGKLYGTTSTGGVNNFGTIFEYEPATNAYTKKFDFGPGATITGGNPKGSLLLYNNKFYGLAADYGASGAGCIFEWDPASNVYTKKYDFTGANGSNPQNSLRLMNGKMYGTTSGGGTNGLGVVFEWDPATNNLTKLLDLTGIGAGTNGWSFYNNVTLYNNKVYCATVRGGLNDYGTLMVIDPSLPLGANTTIIKHFDVTSGGNAGNNEMIVYNNKLYGCLGVGGANSQGTLFELNPTGNVFTKLVDFNYTTAGASPQGKLVLNGAKFLGICSSGGANGTGVVFEWDPANPSAVVKKAEFGPNNFDNTVSPGSTLVLFNSKFYGTTFNAGFVNQGNLFEYDPANNTITKKLSFNAAENGRIPYGKPVLLNGKIYGTCYQGPQEIFGTPYGCLWQFDPSTSVYTRKFLFSNVNNAMNGRAPSSSPIAYNGKLYGTTSAGGTSDYGVLYEFDPATDSYSKKDMQAIGGAYPIGEPTLYNNKMYGMTNANGTGNNGIIYSYDPATGTLAKLYDVQNSGSNVPSGGFAVYNNKLYGATSGGGANNLGAIIVYDPATNTTTSVAAFAAGQGYSVSNAPTLYNNKFYLTALSGGTSGRGSILQFDPATNSLTKMYDCTTTAGGDGYDPKGELTVSGDKLYFIMQEGNNIVNMLELNPANNIIAKKSTYTTSAYNMPVTHNGMVVVPAFIANGIANSCETYPTVVINSSNNNKWVPILNTAGDVVAEIKANGNNLGNVNAGMYINNNAVREDGNKHLYLDRNITITVQNQPASNVDIRLYIKTSEFNALKNAVNSLGQSSGINTINDIAIFKNNQSCAAAFATISTRISTTASNYEYGYVLAASVNSFSSFYFARNNFTALPVSLLSFTANKQGKQVQLNWRTENEVNFSKFDVEKSTDAVLFNSLATVTAENRPVNNYTTADAAPAKGYNYYRLKMTDLDGSYKYSDIVKINFDGKPTLSLWPNPASNQLIVTEAKQNDRVVITDATGRTVLRKTISAQNEPLLIDKLSSGIYVLHLYSDKQITRSNFVKQ